MNNFNKMLALGKQGENLFIERAKASPYLSIIEDVRDNPVYQKVDIDFRIKKLSLDGTQDTTLEVKSDFSHVKTKNMFFQECNNLNTGRIGDLFRTQAEYLAYVFAPEEKVYVFNTNELKGFILWNSGLFTHVSNTGGERKTSGFIIKSKLFFEKYTGTVVVLNKDRSDILRTK